VKYFILSLLLIASIGSRAQIFKVPDLVKQSFDKQYPAAKEVDWNGGVDNHTVQFKLDDKKYKASYTPSGSWNYTETKVAIDSLPKSVQLSFGSSNYKTWTVKECIEVIKPRAEANEYKIIVQKSAINKRVLLFDAKGRLYEELRSF
jgi:Putative beta-lactamase-inhibitor-like, PepSY-like